MTPFFCSKGSSDRFSESNATESGEQRVAMKPKSRRRELRLSAHDDNSARPDSYHCTLAAGSAGAVDRMDVSSTAMITFGLMKVGLSICRYARSLDNATSASNRPLAPFSSRPCVPSSNADS